VFSYENLDNAVIAYNKIIARVASFIKENDTAGVDKEAFDALKARFTAALDNDLNTSLAVTAVYDVLKAKTNAATKLALLDDFDYVLGLNMTAAARKIVDEENAAAAAAASDPFVQEIEALIAERTEAKKAKNYARADEIRAILADKGVTIKDTSQGTQYTIN
jgi:cysteinyl-tRNA synthetase